MSDEEHAEINFARLKVSGVGGLGLVAMAGIMAYALPEARGFVVGSLIGGAIIGVAYVAFRRWIAPDPPHGPTLMVDTSAQTGATPEPHRDKHPIKLGTVSGLS